MKRVTVGFDECRLQAIAGIGVDVYWHTHLIGRVCKRGRRFQARQWSGDEHLPIGPAFETQREAVAEIWINRYDVPDVKTYGPMSVPKKPR